MLSSLAEVYDLINILKKYVYYSQKKARKKKEEQLSPWNPFPHSEVKCIYHLFLCSAPICTIYTQYIHKCSLQTGKGMQTSVKNSRLQLLNSSHAQKKAFFFLLKSSHSCRTISKYVLFFPSTFKASPRRLQHTFMDNYHLTWEMLENVVKRGEFVYTRE